MADALSVSGLDHLWNPNAEPLFTSKPPEWIATYLPRYCQSVSDRTDSDCRGLALAVRELNRDGFWQRLFPDWETCCLALFKRPAAWVEQVVEGVRVLHSNGHQGEIPRDQALRAAATQAQPLAAHRRPTTEEQGDKGDNNTFIRGSTSQSYLLRRLARDAPEVLERVKSGELKSARAAAIEAGIIKPVPTVRLVPDPTRAAASIVERMDRTWCVALATAIAEQIRDAASRPPP